MSVYGSPALQAAAQASSCNVLDHRIAAMTGDDAALARVRVHGRRHAGAPRRRAMRSSAGGCEAWKAVYRRSGVSVVALSR